MEFGDVKLQTSWVAPVSDASKFKSGIVLAFHSKKPAFDWLSGGLTECPGCKVHAALLQRARSVLRRTRRVLYGCNKEFQYQAGQGPDAEPCNVYVTGYGAGAGVAQIVAYELALQGYRIGTSYLFNSPRVGNAAYAEAMKIMSLSDRIHIFNVVTGRGSAWPLNRAFKPAAFEAYYASSASKALTKMCAAGDSSCGSLEAKPSKGDEADCCSHALAPDEDLCAAWNQQCYLGWSVGSISA